MFWSKKNKTDKHGKPAQDKGKLPASDGSVGKTKGQRTGGAASAQKSSADLRAEALANARAARERVGEETIQKIAAALIRQQNIQKNISLTEQAKNKINQQNSDRVADEIRLLLDDKETK